VTFPHEGPINGKKKVAGIGEEVESSIVSKIHIGKHNGERKKSTVVGNDITETMNILRIKAGNEIRGLFRESGEMKINGATEMRKIVLYFFHPLRTHISIYF
jgi:hypothetical protein